MIPLLLALAVQAASETPEHLRLYLATAAKYASGDRSGALREIRERGPFDISRATSELMAREKLLRSAVELPDEIDFRTVEGAVLLHAEAGLLYLQEQRLPAAKRAFDTSTKLLRFARAAVARAKNKAVHRVIFKAEPEPRWELHASIDPPDFFVALASASLALGFPGVAAPFAEKAREEAPGNAEVQLVLGCAAEAFAVELALLHRDGEATLARRDAEAAFREALALAPKTPEARLRLGKLMLDRSRAADAEPLLALADAGATDARLRYLARLFRARAFERLGQSEHAIGSYRRALETWPDSQAARLGLAHALEKSAGPDASRPLVEAVLDPTRRPDARPDPWFLYPVGPPGLATAAFARVFERTAAP